MSKMESCLCIVVPSQRWNEVVRASGFLSSTVSDEVGP